jgi:hypothetical protein
LLLAISLWLALGWIGTWALARSPEQGPLRLGLIALVWVGGVVLCLGSEALRPGAASQAEHPDPSARRGLWAASALWATALPLVFWLWRQAATPEEPAWTRQPYVDKRWILVLYWTTVLAVLWLPAVIGWLVRQVGRGGAAQDRGSDARDPATGPWLQRKHLVRILLALAVSTAAFGPPWNIEWSSRTVNPHETVHWGGLQAIHAGFLPYVGPAAVNYGPGAQALTYAYMQATDQFSVHGFREFYALSLWAAVFLFCAIALLALPGLPAAAAILAMFIVSPVAGWNWTNAGCLDGFFGWANLLRNIATLMLSFGVFALVRAGPSMRPHRTAALLVGLVWGGLAYFAQENLFGGLLIVGVLLGFAVAGELLSLRGGVTALACLVSGFALVWVPFLAFYSWSGELAALWDNYFLVPGRFLKGYASTHYPGTLSRDPLAVAFYTTPVLALAVGAAAVFELRPLRPARPLSAQRFLVFSMAVAYLAAYPSSLLRSDAVHFQSTTFAVPILMVLGIRLQRLSRASLTRSRFVSISLATLLTLLAFLPTWLDAPARLLQLARGRWQSFVLAQHAPHPEPDSEPARRYGALEAQSRRATIELMVRLKQRVGADPVLVMLDVPPKLKPSHEYVYDGFVYFMADLVPGPILMERSDMVGTSEDLARFRSHLKEHIDEFEWVVSLAQSLPELEIFQAANPGWTMEVLEHSDAKLYLFGRSEHEDRSL